MTIVRQHKRRVGRGITTVTRHKRNTGNSFDPFDGYNNRDIEQSIDRNGFGTLMHNFSYEECKKFLNKYDNIFDRHDIDNFLDYKYGYENPSKDIIYGKNEEDDIYPEDQQQDDWDEGIRYAKKLEQQWKRGGM